MRAGEARARGRRGLRAIACAGGILAGCASPPQELSKLRAENELLREELRIVRQNCSFYRDLEMKIDEGESSESR